MGSTATLSKIKGIHASKLKGKKALKMTVEMNGMKDTSLKWIELPDGSCYGIESDNEAICIFPSKNPTKGTKWDVYSETAGVTDVTGVIEYVKTKTIKGKTETVYGVTMEYKFEGETEKIEYCPGIGFYSNFYGSDITNYTKK